MRVAHFGIDSGFADLRQRRFRLAIIEVMARI